MARRIPTREATIIGPPRRVDFPDAMIDHRTQGKGSRELGKINSTHVAANASDPPGPTAGLPPRRGPPAPPIPGFRLC